MFQCIIETNKTKPIMSKPKISVAIAEPSYILRKGVAYVLSKFDEVSEIVEFSSVATIKQHANLENADILIINPNLMGAISKVEIRNFLNLPDECTIIALLSTLTDENWLRAYDGIISTIDPKVKLRQVIKDAFDRKKTNQSESEELSNREIEILTSVVKGMSNKEIADHHHISIHTVITHRRNITRKLKIYSTSGLTIYAIINNLIDISDIKYQNK